MTKVFRSKITLSAVSATSSLNTVLLFDKRQKVHGGSPIDEFLGRITHLNRAFTHTDGFRSFRGTTYSSRRRRGFRELYAGADSKCDGDRYCKSEKS